MIDPNVSLLLNLPEGALPFIGAGHVQLAIYKQTRYHWCPQCDGWIIGDPLTKRESEHGILCGRCGKAYLCRRASHELGFDGCYF